jgi:hypothetical protein
MKHLWRTIGIVGLATVVGLGAGGCSEAETGLYISSALASTPPQCVLRADPSSLQLPGGTLDVSIGINPSYFASLLVGNQLTTRGDKENLRSETMIVTITGAEVRLLDDVGAITDEFTVPATGVIEPDSGDDPGFGIVRVPLIPVSLALDLRDQMLGGALPRGVTRVARVKVFGSTIGGVDIESSEFTFVIVVCYDCLIDTPPGVDCNDPEGAPEAPCNKGQDARVDCRNLG